MTITYTALNRVTFLLGYSSSFIISRQDEMLTSSFYKSSYLPSANIPRVSATIRNPQLDNTTWFPLTSELAIDGISKREEKHSNALMV